MPQPAHAAFIAELFDRHAAALEFYARQWTSLAADCVQEAFVELARECPPPPAPKAWLYRVVRNRALNFARGERRRAWREEIAGRRRAAKATDDPQEAAEISDLLDLLNDEQQEIVVLRIWGQLSWQEIAHVTSASKSGAHRSYVAALELLRTHMEPSSCPTSIPGNPR